MSLSLNDILDMPTNTPEPTPEPEPKLKLHGSLQDCAAKVAPKPDKRWPTCRVCEGDKEVWHHKEQAWVTCPRCAGKGFFTADDKQRKARHTYMVENGKRRDKSSQDYITSRN